MISVVFRTDIEVVGKSMETCSLQNKADIPTLLPIGASVRIAEQLFTVDSIVYDMHDRKISVYLEPDESDQNFRLSENDNDFAEMLLESGFTVAPWHDDFLTEISNKKG